GKLLSLEVLLSAPGGGVKVRPSLLPRWRAAAPIPRTILAGDEKTGVTIMQMDSGLDTGAILLREETPVPADADCGELGDILSEMGAKLLLRALRENPPPRPQENTGARYAAKIRPAERILDFNESAETLARRVRAFSPSPGARAFWKDGEMIKITAARAVDAPGASGAPGEILSADADGIVVACGGRALSLLRLQRAGRGIVAAADFARGFRGAPPAFSPPPFAA
ncbi:MAG: methionyl-tRNA formyltransferase, partial [Gammaproteobacteria bacterium]